MSPTNRNLRIVIVGGVAGGMSAATRLRRLSETAQITVFERSGYVSYANCGLPYYLGGVIDFRDSLILQTPEGLADRFRLDVRVRHEVTKLDRAAKQVHFANLETGEQSAIGYDVVILSPGAQTIVPPLPGIERALPLRNVEDVDRLFERVEQQPRHATVIGGGFIGLEAVENLRHRGIPVTLVEAAPQVLTPLDAEMVSPIADSLRFHDVDLRLESQAVGITDQAVQLADGSSVETDLVILAIGVRPDVSLATTAGLEIGTRGGIKVNAFQQTSDPAIYAIGDAAEKQDAVDHNGTLIPLANLANRHGRVVADHIVGRPVRQVPAIGAAIVKVFDTVAATVGWNERRLRAAGIEFDAIHTHPGSHAGYYPGAEQMSLKLLFSPTDGRIFGAQAVGGAGVDKRIDVIATAMRAGIRADELMDLELAYAPPFSSAKDPINMLGYVADNRLNHGARAVQWSDLAAELAAGATLLDVRTAWETDRGTIPGAVTIPLNDLRERAGELPAGGRVVVYCRVGHTAHTAAMLLDRLGFDAVNLDGGYSTWLNSPAGALD